VAAGSKQETRAKKEKKQKRKENRQQQFSFLANLSSSVDGSPTVEEAAAFYLDPR
jgi:hypothetical protein